jgi:hypothetical protein
MLNIKLFIWCLLLTSAMAIADNISYPNSYKDLYVGISTYSDVVKSFGAPHDKKLGSNNVKYIYSNFHVTIQDSTARINTIIIFDEAFVDPNKVKVGMPVKLLETKLNRKIARRVVTDRSKGIIYWIANDKVIKIVLVYELAAH